MKISFIGAGNMASAIIKSVIASGKLKAEDLYVYDKFSEKCNEFRKLGVNKCESLTQACNCAECILIAVKPQDYEALLIDVKINTQNIDSKIIITIAAAISCDYICSTLEIELPVIRVMPNTPILLGVGATAISRNEYVNDKVYSKICGIFACCGNVVSLDESLMNNVISVNSSSPVYLYMLAKAMIESGINQGISEKNATELVYQTLKGSCEMLIKSGMSPDRLIDAVASPGGTTLSAISSLENSDFNKIINDAMQACTNRANELAR